MKANSPVFLLRIDITFGGCFFRKGTGLSGVTFWVLVMLVSSRHTCNSTFVPRPNEELTTENDL